MLLSPFKYITSFESQPCDIDREMSFFPFLSREEDKWLLSGRFLVVDIVECCSGVQIILLSMSTSLEAGPQALGQVNS